MKKLSMSLCILSSVIGSSFLGDKRRFRTSKELAKHFAWLCQYGDLPSLRCDCKHCGIMYADRKQPLGAEIVRSLGSNPPSPRKRGQQLPEIQILQLEDLEQELEMQQSTPEPEPEPDLETLLFDAPNRTGSGNERSHIVASTSANAGRGSLPTFIRKEVSKTIVENSVINNGEETLLQRQTTFVKSVTETVEQNYYMAALADRKGKGRELAPFKDFLEIPGNRLQPPKQPQAKRRAPRKSRQEEDEDSDYGNRADRKRLRSLTAEPPNRDGSVLEDGAPAPAEGARRSSRVRTEIKDYYALPASFQNLERVTEEEADKENKKKPKQEGRTPFIHKERYIIVPESVEV